jgi:hypothetical protein
LKENGKLSFIIDVSFFETAYEFTRKYLLDNTTIDELQVNIKDFDVASGQVIIKLSKTKSVNHKVQIIDHKTENRYLVNSQVGTIKMMSINSDTMVAQFQNKF